MPTLATKTINQNEQKKHNNKEKIHKQHKITISRFNDKERPKNYESISIRTYLPLCYRKQKSKNGNFKEKIKTDREEAREKLFLS